MHAKTRGPSPFSNHGLRAPRCCQRDRRLALAAAGHANGDLCHRRGRSGPLTARNRTDPPPLSAWDPLVIPRSRCGASGVQPARSRTTPPGVGRGRRQGGIWRSWPTLVSRLLGLLPNRGVCECDLAHRRLYGGCLLRHKKCVDFAFQFVSSWDLIAE